MSSPEAVVSPDLSVADRLNAMRRLGHHGGCPSLFKMIRAFDRYGLELGGLFGLLQNRITDETALLYEWARDVRLEDARDRMFAGEKVTLPKGVPYCIPFCVAI